MPEAAIKTVCRFIAEDKFIRESEKKKRKKEIGGEGERARIHVGVRVRGVRAAAHRVGDDLQ